MVQNQRLMVNCLLYNIAIFLQNSSKKCKIKVAKTKKNGII